MTKAMQNDVLLKAGLSYRIVCDPEWMEWTEGDPPPKLRFALVDVDDVNAMATFKAMNSTSSEDPSGIM